MSDSSVIFKRTKSKPKQRARDTPGDAAEQPTDVAEDEPSPSAVASKIKNKAKQRAKPKTSLSFGGDEEEGDGEAFKIKKSNLSQKLSLGRHPTSSGHLPSNLDQATITASATRGPVYDQAYLNELKASTPTSRPTAIQGDVQGEDISMNFASDDSVRGGIDAFDVGATSIPSQSFVLAAKEKRERLRVSGTAGPNPDDYISLSVTKHDEEYRGPHPESRLMREDDDLGEGDDDFAEYTSAQTRIALGKKARKAEASRLRGEMQDLIADADEVDEETQEWEQAQIKRSGLKTDDGISPAAVVHAYRPTPIPPPTEIPTLDVSIARISQLMTSMTTSHSQNTASMSALVSEQSQLDSREDELREIITKAEEKRSWFVGFREWLESIATFLDEKFPQLEKLEEEHVSILKERREMIYTRRRADNLDDLSIFLGSLPVQPHTGPEELDEMGRIIPRLNPEAAQRDRQAARTARRSRRQRENRQRQGEEGYSTDATLPPSDGADYLAALDQLSQKRDSILSDVKAKEYKNPSLGIGSRFAGWRERFGDSYTSAWGGLGLVGAWEFWARLEILGWNPFEDSRTLDSYHWYSDLYKYSRPARADEDEEERELGPDGDLVSAIISTVVIPRLCMLIEAGALDPFSSNDVRRVVDLAEEIELSVEKTDHKVQMLFKSILGVFQGAVSDTKASQDPYLALTHPPFRPDAIASRRRLLRRQEKLMANIVRLRRYQDSLFGVDDVVKSLLLECILPVANSGWEVGGEESIHRVAQLLPKELVTAQIKAQLGISGP
ncbi:nineteen complex-related protein 2-domain-containing protein [Gloeopeniophorella convolvens]|nr:nineteen complex-related protein 2-domain-containing protein [Gloeopeniophorella convolvens]